MGEFADATDNFDHLEVTRSMISQGKVFRLHLKHLDQATVAVDLEIGDDDGHDDGRLHGQLLAADLAAASRALTSLFGGAASVLLPSPGSPAAKERLEKIRKKHPNAYTPWTAEDDQRLLQLYAANVGVPELARRFGRQPSAIRARLEKVLVPETPTAEIDEPA